VPITAIDPKTALIPIDLQAAMVHIPSPPFDDVLANVVELARYWWSGLFAQPAANSRRVTSASADTGRAGNQLEASLWRGPANPEMRGPITAGGGDQGSPASRARGFACLRSAGR
jgi:hypothetical protein